MKTHQPLFGTLHRNEEPQQPVSSKLGMREYRILWLVVNLSYLGFIWALCERSFQQEDRIKALETKLTAKP